MQDCFFDFAYCFLALACLFSCVNRLFGDKTAIHPRKTNNECFAYLPSGVHVLACASSCVTSYYPIVMQDYFLDFADLPSRIGFSSFRAKSFVARSLFLHPPRRGSVFQLAVLPVQSRS